MNPEPSNQELLERYVFTIKTLLPRDKAHDIAAEIQSNLQSLVGRSGHATGSGSEP